MFAEPLQRYEQFSKFLLLTAGLWHDLRQVVTLNNIFPHFQTLISKGSRDLCVSLTILYVGFTGCRTSPKCLPVGALSTILGINVLISCLKNGGSGPVLRLATVPQNRGNLLRGTYSVEAKTLSPEPTPPKCLH